MKGDGADTVTGTWRRVRGPPSNWDPDARHPALAPVRELAVVGLQPSRDDQRAEVGDYTTSSDIHRTVTMTGEIETAIPRI